MAGHIAAAAALLFTGSVLVSGCAADGSVIQSGDSSILVGPEGNGENIAAVGYDGDVAIVGSCLGMDEYAVVWPYGTEVVDSDPLSIRVPGVGLVTVGDHLSGGAVIYEDGVPSDVPPVPSNCSTTHVVVFFPDR